MHRWLSQIVIDNERNKRLSDQMKRFNEDLSFTSNGGAYFSKILEVGEEFDHFDIEGSLYLSVEEHCKANRCFENCQRIVTEYKDLRYCEGYLACPHAEEHAWLVSEEGVVLDPTVVLHPILHGYVKGYLGVEIPIEFLIIDLFDDTKWESFLDKYIFQQITDKNE